LFKALFTNRKGVLENASCQSFAGIVQIIWAGTSLKAFFELGLSLVFGIFSVYSVYRYIKLRHEH